MNSLNKKLTSFMLLILFFMVSISSIAFTIAYQSTGSTDGSSVNNSKIIACIQYSPPPADWCSNGTIVPQPLDRDGCSVPARCVYAGNVTTCAMPKCQDYINTGIVDGNNCIIYTCPSTICQAGCVCNGEVTICSLENSKIIETKIETETTATNISISKSEGESGIISIVSGNVMMTTSEKVSVQNSKLILESASGNGFKEIKIMPDTASERAQEVLGLKCEERNCTIVLKEVPMSDKDIIDDKNNGEDPNNRTEGIESDQSELIYEVEGVKDSKLLGVINKEMKVKAQVDAQTGEVVKIEKPWWAFLAKEEK
jgi:hypothetical protein